jgi:hypothetical protein
MEPWNNGQYILICDGDFEACYVDVPWGINESRVFCVELGEKVSIIERRRFFCQWDIDTYHCVVQWFDS